MEDHAPLTITIVFVTLITDGLKSSYLCISISTK